MQAVRGAGPAGSSASRLAAGPSAAAEPRPRYFYGLCHSSVSASHRHLWIYSENVPVRRKSVSVTLDVLTACLRLKRTCSTLEYGA